MIKTFRSPNSLDSASAPKFSRYAEETLAQVNRAFENGMSHAKDALGFHGTSIQALKHGMLAGGLHGSPVAHLKAPIGSLFFYPRPDLFPDPMRPSSYQSLEGTIEKAKVSAENIARTHHLLEAFNLDFQDRKHLAYVMDLLQVVDNEPLDNEQRLRTFLVDRNIDFESAVTLAESTKKISGMVFVLAKDALDVIAPTAGDDIHTDFKLALPDKILPFKYFSGIEPLDDASFEFLNSLG